MKIEAGKFYKTRDGRKVGPISRVREGEGDYYWSDGASLFGMFTSNWSKDGISSDTSAGDIISEWPILTPHQQRTAEMIKVMQAYVDGEEIEVLGYVSKKWVECFSPIWNWKDVDYRIAPAATPDTIDWSHVAPEFKWMARDSTGQCYLFTEKPKIGESVWYESDDEITAENFASYRPGTCDWKDSLVKRPE